METTKLVEGLRETVPILMWEERRKMLLEAAERLETLDRQRQDLDNENKAHREKTAEVARALENPERELYLAVLCVQWMAKLVLEKLSGDDQAVLIGCAKRLQDLDLEHKQVRNEAFIARNALNRVLHFIDRGESTQDDLKRIAEQGLKK